jgi:multidrug efflux pump
VLSAVFLPMAFLSGSTGVIYRQFSVTIVSAMMLSVLIALILTPALCASLLKAKKKGANEAKKGFFGWFNRAFDKSNRLYIKGVSVLTSRLAISGLAFCVICGLLGFLFMRMPTGFLPDEDQGILFGQVSTPPGATAEQTAAIIGQVSDYVLSAEKDNVASVLAVNGFNFSGQAQNAGFFFFSLKDWKARSHTEQSAAAIAKRVTQHFGTLRDAQVLIIQPPPVLELGNATGFDLELEDRGNLGHDKLLAARNQFLSLAKKDPRLAQVRPNGLEDAPQYKLLVDREKASALGLSIGDINDTIQDSFGSLYVDQFLRQGRKMTA